MEVGKIPFTFYIQNWFYVEAEELLHLFTGVDRFHPLNTKLSQQLEDVERRLSHISVDQDIHTQREDDTESISDASQSPRPDLANGHVINASQPPQMFSTPYRDNRNSSRITRQVIGRDIMFKE